MIPRRKIAYHTLGCKLNFAETSSISRILEKNGFEKVDFEEGADVFVINTCSVTENADKECRYLVRKALRHSPEAHIVVIGCYAQLKPGEIASIKGVDLVLGANEKFRIGDYLQTLPEKKRRSGTAGIYSCDINDVNIFESSYSLGERTRAFLKVQDGCDYSCTYCTIPLARGKSRSDTITHVVDQSHLLADSGVKEIVLTGVNIGDFGLSDTESGMRHETFFRLIQRLDDIEGIDRFRISSIEPNLLSEDIIEFVASSKRFMPHLHIPLQSGSDPVLKRMKRRYLSPLYRDRVLKIRKQMPHCCIGADVIVGFPGESEKEFLETYNFINDLEVSYLHVFTYSERENTEAAVLPDVIPMAVRQERNKMLRNLSEKKRRAFYQNHVNDNRKVLFETETKDGRLEGHTDNYIRVRIPLVKNLRGKIAITRLEETEGEWMNGFVANNQYSVVPQAIMI